MKNIRAFLSFNLSEGEKKILSGYQEKLKNLLTTCPVKWEDPEKFHLTIRFLGNVSEENIKMLIFTCERLKFSFDEIKFRLTGTGFFPDRKRPRVIFFEFAEISSSCNTIITFIDKIIRNFGVKTENKFVPHITTGRFPKNTRTEIENNFSYIPEPIEISFNSFYLMKSILTSSGSVYEVIHEFKFNS
ncbi:MAG: RNA 2',3'-cyclic phosphodiesterase [Ignavibacteria bacterium]|nr:RNA 2',3'-cyclic phosphodiesterase [Ignavibacteria bacterium]